jgi:hypothetical protein
MRNYGVNKVVISQNRTDVCIILGVLEGILAGNDRKSIRIGENWLENGENRAKNE